LPAGALARLGTTRMRHRERVNHVLFAPDGKTVASGGVDDTVRLWDVATGKLVRSLKHTGLAVYPRPIFFSWDATPLISCSLNQSALWDINTGELLRASMLKLAPKQQVCLQAISSDGQMAASPDGDADIRLWDVTSGNPLRLLQGEKKRLIPVSFSPDKQILA